MLGYIVLAVVVTAGMLLSAACYAAAYVLDRPAQRQATRAER